MTSAPLGQGEEYELRAPGLERTYDPEHDAKLIDWRTLSFLSLGFSPVVASVMAIRRDIDRELVERMVRRGATPLQVAAILL